MVSRKNEFDSLATRTDVDVEDRLQVVLPIGDPSDPIALIVCLTISMSSWRVSPYPSGFICS